MNVLLVPTLSIDTSLVFRLAASVDHPIAHKVVINNGPVGALHDFKAKYPNWTVIEHGRNLGVAASWNLAAKMFHVEQRFLILNDDSVFGKGSIKAIAEFKPFYHVLFTNIDWCGFVWTRAAIELCGEFDENFYPGYYEDTDMFVRMGNTGAVDAWLECGMTHGRGSHPEWYERKRSLWCQENERYFQRKWGRMSLKLHKPFTRPFNKPYLENKQWFRDEAHLAMVNSIWLKG